MMSQTHTRPSYLSAPHNSANSSELQFRVDLRTNIYFHSTYILNNQSDQLHQNLNPQISWWQLTEGMVLGQWPRRTSFAHSSCGTLRTRPRTWRSRTWLTCSAKMCSCTLRIYGLAFEMWEGSLGRCQVSMKMDPHQDLKQTSESTTHTFTASSRTCTLRSKIFPCRDLRINARIRMCFQQSARCL